MKYAIRACEIHGEVTHYGEEAELNCLRCTPLKKQPHAGRLKELTWSLNRGRLEQCFAEMSLEQLEIAKGMICEKEHYLRSFNRIMEPLKRSA